MSKNYRNSGYKNGGRNDGYKRPYRDDVREFDSKPQSKKRYYDDRDTRRDDVIELNVKRFKKKDIKIVDLNGNTYIINGNFSHEFAIEVGRFQDAANKIVENKKKNPSIDDVSSLHNLYKECCLLLLNYNIDGKQYTMDDVNRGFNDLNALAYIMNNIFFIVDKDTKDIGKVN